MKPGSERGFSLIELTLVVTLLAVLSVGFARYFGQSIQGWKWTADQTRQATLARLTMDRICREIADMDDVALMGTLLPSELVLPQPDGTFHGIAWSGTPGDTLFLETDEGEAPLCPAVDSLGFSYFDAAGLPTTSAAAVGRIGVGLRIGSAGHATYFRSLVHVRNQ